MTAKAPLFVSYCAKDMLDGVLMLDPMTELAYRRVCDLIYATKDRLKDDDARLANATKIGLAKWRKAKKELIELEKIEIIEGRITNERCRKEIKKSLRNIAQKSTAAAARWDDEKSAQSEAGNSLENNNTGDAAAYAGEDAAGYAPEHPTGDAAAYANRELRTNREREEAAATEEPREERPPPPPQTARPADPPEQAAAAAVSISNDQVRAGYAAFCLMAKQYGHQVPAKLTKDRGEAIRSRMAEHGPEAWAKVIDGVQGSDWLAGRKDRGWKVDLDYLCRPEGFLRALEEVSTAAKPEAANDAGKGRTDTAEEAKWRKRYEAYRADGFWPSSWGPKPPNDDGPRRIRDEVLGAMEVA